MTSKDGGLGTPQENVMDLTNMTLEQQVTSLELSKKLKELGVKQESLFYWYDNKQVGGTEQTLVYFGDKGPLHSGLYYSAFTVAELGGMLPGIVNTNNFGYGHRDWTIKCSWIPMEHFVTYKCAMCSEELDAYKDGFEANARAKMLIYLIETKFITL